MTIYAKIITLAAVLVALAVGAPLQAQTPEIDALRARAEEGVASAQFSLGFMYATGLAVPQDDAEAVRWWQLGADQGLANAQFNLVVMYDGIVKLTKIGVIDPQDIVGDLLRGPTCWVSESA
jgi:TPR repeat protein